MTSGMTLALIILAVLTASLWYIVDAEGGWSQVPVLLERVGIEVSIPEIKPIELPRYNPDSDEESEVPVEYQSGSSRFSNGTCATVADCAPAGCSQEVCSNDPNVVTTCEYSPSFPNARGYNCTCLPTGFCGWDDKTPIYD